MSHTLNRRAALAGSSIAFATSTLAAPKKRTRYSIKPVMWWDARKDAFEPYFPVGWYSFGSSAQIMELAANGSNTALYAGLGTESYHLPDTLKQLNIASKLGVKIVLGLAPSVVGRVVLNDRKTHGVIPQYVKTFNKHPAVLGWQLGDEFSPEAAPRINDTVALLRKLGSKHQTWQVHPHTWGAKAVKKLMARTDVCTFDGYTYLESLPEFHTHAAARVLAWEQGKADLIQAHGWSGNVNVTQAVGCKCGTAKFRFPTTREYRWTVFSAISTAGVRGTLNWIYAYWGGFYHKDPKRFFKFRDEVVKPVNLEQRMLGRAMEQGYNVGHVSSNFDAPTTTKIPPAGGDNRPYQKIGYILLHDARNKKYYLVATNNEPSEKKVVLTLSMLPQPLKGLEVSEPKLKRKLRLSKLQDNSFALQDSLSGYDVKIYVLT